MPTTYLQPLAERCIAASLVSSYPLLARETGGLARYIGRVDLSLEIPPPLVGDRVPAAIDLLDEPAIGKLPQPGVDVPSGVVDVARDDLRRQLHPRVIERLQDEMVYGQLHPITRFASHVFAVGMSGINLSDVIYLHHYAALNNLLISRYTYGGGVETDVVTTGRARSARQKKLRAGDSAPDPAGRWNTTMSNHTTATHKGRHTDGASDATDTIAADLQCGGWGGWDARDVLAGRIDDATVRQAVEGQR